MKKIRLGINIDHIATLRNARGGDFPCPIFGAQVAKEAGANGITAHLREDRRHIRDEDIFRLKQEVDLPLNFEMAATEEMVNIAIKLQPNAVCLVPEKRQEITTEGGLDVVKNQKIIAEVIKKLKTTKEKNRIRVSIFVDPNLKQVLAAKEVDADIIEIHTGHFCQLKGKKQKDELKVISEVAIYANEIGLECHAGHGLDFKTAKKIAQIPQIVELNIGHFIVSQALFFGLDNTIRKMKKIISF